MSVDDHPISEKSRICPSCRMQISVLAVKCRFCGEEVGKPKEEQRTLSINDLGGELVHHRAPSGSVMEAMEAFRVETGLEEAEQEGASGAPVIPTVGADGMPVLNEAEFGPTINSQSSSISSVQERRPASFMERFRTIGLVVGGLVIGIFVALQVPGWIAEYRESEAKGIEPVFVNRVPEMIRSGDSPIDTLRVAMEAIDHENSAQNRRIAEDALYMVIARVRRLLDATPFNESNLSQASVMANHAADLYPNEKTRDLLSEMQNERTAYRMVLISVDKDKGTATFKPNTRGSKLVPVQVGDTLAGRFYVKTIVGDRFVTLQDRLRKGRIVTFETGGGIRAN